MCDAKLENGASYEDVEKIAQFLKNKIKFQPSIGIICGTGLGSVTTLLQQSVILDYEEIPNFPVSTVQGHSGQLCFGYIASVPVVCMKGRIHYYEGYPLWQCTLPVRVMKLLGINTLIVSNAAGGIKPSFEVGDIMLIKDHLNLVGLTGLNPLIGPNDERFGPRFVAVTDAYDAELFKIAKQVGQELSLNNLQEGVYACVGGPNFETVAELRALRLLGADCVGMSTVHEVLVARHCGIKCFAFSLVTNKCELDYEVALKPDHDDILNVGSRQEDTINMFVEKIIQLFAEKM